MDTPQKPDRLHLDYLDGIRALAAILVVASHAFLTVYPFWGAKHPSALVYALSFWMMFGHFAVSLFIVISGFCLMLPVIRNRGEMKGGAKTFFMRRAKRILPPYYLSVALSWLLIVLLVGTKTNTHWDLCIPITKMGWISHLLLFQNWMPFEVYAQINHAHWSIALECQIYLLFPLLVLLWRRIGAVGTAVVATAIGYAIVVIIIKRYQGQFLDACPHYLGLFGMGMLAATIGHGSQERWLRLREKRFWIPIALLLALLVGAGNMLLKERAYENGHWFDLLVGLASMCLLIGVGASPKGRLNAFLSLRPLVTVGGFSYSVYLIHAPLLQIIWQYLLPAFHRNDGLSLFLLVVPGTLLIIGASYLFYLGCERPFLNTRR